MVRSRLSERELSFAVLACSATVSSLKVKVASVTVRTSSPVSSRSVESCSSCPLTITPVLGSTQTRRRLE